MTIGAVLLQPQTLNRFSEFGFDQSLGDDAVALMQRLAMHPDWMEALMDQVSGNLEDYIADLQSHVEARMTAAQSAMEGMLRPFIDNLNDLFPDDIEVETVGDGLQLVLDVVDRFAAFVETLSLDHIRAWIEDLLDILFETLGFNPDYLISLFERFIDVVIAAMETIPAGASNEYIELQWQVAALARRLKRDILNDVPDLGFNSETIARQVIAKLREMGLETVQEKAHCLAGKVRSLVDVGTSIYDLVKGAEGGGSAGALVWGPLLKIPAIEGGSKYCWYASWLYQNRRRKKVWKFFGTYLLPLVPKDEVWISEDGRQLVLRHATEAENPGLGSDEQDEVLYSVPEGTTLNWYDAPQFRETSSRDENFTFTSALSPQFMETWTMVTNLLVTVSRLTGHVVFATEPGNHVTHSILSAWHTSRLFGEAITGAPFTSFIRDKWGIPTKHRWVVDLLFNWMPVFGGSFEGFNTGSNGGFQHWMTLIGDDAHDNFLIYLWPTLVHEGFLSLFTLINYKGPGYTDFQDNNKPKNYEYSFPLTNVWLVLFSFLQSRALGRRYYSHPFEETHMKHFLLHQLLFSWMFGALAGISGELTGWALSRSVSPRRLLIQMGWGAYKGFGTYIITSYFWNEGDTDGGRYNPDRQIDPVSGDISYIEGPEFAGYKEMSTTPYRLPIGNDRPVFVGQANQGMFSHFIDDDGTIQIYAADFAHAFREEVVAIRDGTVVDYFDWIADDIDPETADQNAARDAARASGNLVSNGTNSQTAYTDPGSSGNPNGPGVGSWNFIIIQHNDPFNRETADERAHDRDTGDQPTTTYAFYGHGANSGVRDAFSDRGISANNIIGQTVRRGEVVMLAGDTGVSFHNHLHLHVRPGPAPAAPAASPGSSTSAQIVNTGAMMGNRTIPIVFADARNRFSKNGRLKRLTWYRSRNEVEGP